jgi:TonB-linked SusC/RagA family outer membrane protein
MRFNLKRAIGVLLLALLTQISFAQNVVTGRVTDSKDGGPVGGATISVKGSKTGTKTQADGSFSISIPASASTLVVTCVGYAPQEVPVAGKSSVAVSLTITNTTMNEVVVTGYGTTRRKDLTGSVTLITSKDFQKGAITTPEQLISGKVAGVSIISNGGAPGSGSTIRIRGGSSLNASNDPLIVIDGVPIENAGIAGVANALALINPNDIESFNILKDASATAIYGSRASNGVIIIVTKKGKSGKPQFNFNTQLSVSEVYKVAPVLSPQQFRDYVNAHGTAAQIALMGNASTDWQKEIFHTALSTDNNLSVAGAVPHMPYRISAGYLKQNGILKTGSLDRLSGSINLSPRLLKDHLKIDINLKGVHSTSRFADEGAIGAAANFDPTQPVMDPNKSTRYGGYFEWRDNTNARGLLALAPKNPVGLLEQKQDNSNVSRSIGNIQFDYKLPFMPSLRANLNLGYDVSTGKGTVLINDSAASTYKRSDDLRHGGVNNQYKSKKSNTLLEFYLSYAHEFNKIRSHFDIMGGYSYQDFKTTITNFPDYAFDKYVIKTPTFPFDVPENRLISYFGRTNFTMSNKYLLTASLRRDGSSRFSPNNRWGWFPSGAFAWKLKDENFLRYSKTISELKFRIGYGITGQQDGIGNYDYYAFYSVSNAQAQYQFGSTFYNAYRPSGYYSNRKWEETATSNAGLDFGFLNNRITGSLDFYHKKTKDLLNLVSQPAGTNFSNQIIANVGNMRNNGIEFTINTGIIARRDLTWDFSYNITYNNNRITNLTLINDPSYPGNKYGGISGGVNSSILINSVGFPRGSFYVYKQVYDASGKPVDNAIVDLNGDGTINQSDLYRYKSPDPRYLMGASSNFTYKNWNGGFVARASLKNYMYNNIASSTGTDRNIRNPLNFLANGSTDILRSGFSGNGDKYLLSDYYVENASFFRMDNIYVGYNFGKVMRGVTNLRVNANVQNVFIVTKYRGVDPEISGGIDNNFYPRPRIYVVGVSLDF